MSQIMIDRDFLQRMLDRLFDLEADVLAYRWTVMQVQSASPAKAIRYADEHRRRSDEEKRATEAQRKYLQESLSSGDDDAFRRTLYAQFPSR